MNAILAVVFLVACASAQTTFDRTTDLERILYGKHHNTDLTDLFRTGKQYNNRLSSWDVSPRSYYNYDKYDTTTIYSLDEIVRHPLFRTYVTLPLFRQHLSHRLFQYYLTTPLFQKYWTIPEFQTFFQNPYLFYKYVYPVVYNTHHQGSSIYDVDTLYPTTSSDVVDRVDVDRLYNNDVYSQYRNVLPYDSLYNKYNTIYGQQYPSTVFNRNHIPYKTVMERIFKNYYVNKPAVEVITDVKVSDKVVDDYKYPNGDFNKIVDDIVPVVGDRKYVVDDIIARRPIDRTTNVIDQLIGGEYPVDKLNKYNLFEGKHFLNTKDAMLKRLYLNKMMYGDRKIDEVYPEYTTEMKNIPILEKIEKLNKLHRLENIVEKMNGVDKFDKYETPSVDSELFRNKDLLTRIPLTKEIKNSFDLEFPTTKTVVV